MLKRFLKNIEECGIVRKKERILLAVSGGIDSMVMADLFSKTSFDTGIAHCNFKLRGTDSDNDELFVKEYASSAGRPFYTVSFDTKGYAREKRISIEMAARELRYKWFEEIRQKYGYDLVALAHNMNDNIETILINLARGTGIAGLTGMKPREGLLIRPLLFATRREIEEYASACSVSFREDVTNAELRFIRNRIRHQIIPLFREINPSFESTVAGTAERLTEIEEILVNYVRDIKTNVIKKEENGIIIFDINKLLRCKPLKTILFEIFRPYGLTTGQLNGLIRLLSGRTGAALLTESHRILKNRNEVIVTKKLPVENIVYNINTLNDFHQLPFIEKVELTEIKPGFKTDSDPLAAFLDADTVSFPLVIRKWEYGDRFFPLGMGCEKKLSDYFTDRKFSLPDKEKTLVMVSSSGEIIWILGERIDDRHKITPVSSKVIIIRLKDNFKFK